MRAPLDFDFDSGKIPTGLASVMAGAHIIGFKSVLPFGPAVPLIAALLLFTGFVGGVHLALFNAF